jgi:RNA polymerase sigma-70 factor (ECF subfamily)
MADRYPTLLRTAYLILGNRPDAEDAVQEGFVRAWRFRSSLNDDARMGAWLHRVVVTACYSKLRRDIPRRDRRSPGDGLDQLPGTELHPEEASERADASERVLGAIGLLPVTLRIPVVLRYYAELSEREIAIAVGCRQGTVKSRLHEPRRRLATDPDLRSFTGHDDAEKAEAGR